MGGAVPRAFVPDPSPNPLEPDDSSLGPLAPPPDPLLGPPEESPPDVEPEAPPLAPSPDDEEEAAGPDEAFPAWPDELELFDELELPDEEASRFSLGSSDDA